MRSFELDSEFDWIETVHPAAVTVAAPVSRSGVLLDDDARTIEDFDAYGWDPYEDARPFRTA